MSFLCLNHFPPGRLFADPFFFLVPFLTSSLHFTPNHLNYFLFVGLLFSSGLCHIKWSMANYFLIRFVRCLKIFFSCSLQFLEVPVQVKTWSPELVVLLGLILAAIYQRASRAAGLTLAAYLDAVASAGCFPTELGCQGWAERFI